MAGPNESGALPPEVPPEYADAYRRAYERALRESEETTASAPASADLGEEAEAGEVSPDETPGHAPGTEPTAVLPRMPAPQPPESAAAESPATEPSARETSEPVAPRHAAPRPPAAEYAAPQAAQQTVPPASQNTQQAPRPAPHREDVPSGAVWRDDVPAILAPAVGEHRRQEEEYDEEQERRRKYLPPLLLLVLALVLVLAAYGIGRVFAGGVEDTDTSSGEPNGVSLGEGGGSDVQKTKQGPYRGPVQAAPIGGAQASCQSDDSVDAAGNPVSYEPANVYDGDVSTAWRCDGSGVGATFTINLAQSTKVGEVGLVPGYAKTDARSGVDRYAENNRITRVRWVFSDGTTQVQKMSGSATDRDLRRMRVPRTKADQVTIEILDSKRGPRNTVAISEVWVGAVAG